MSSGPTWQSAGGEHWHATTRTPQTTICPQHQDILVPQDNAASYRCSISGLTYIKVRENGASRFELA